MDTTLALAPRYKVRALVRADEHPLALRRVLARSARVPVRFIRRERSTRNTMRSAES